MNHYIIGLLIIAFIVLVVWLIDEGIKSKYKEEYEYSLKKNFKQKHGNENEKDNSHNISASGRGSL